jgi:hypothetical protein
MDSPDLSIAPDCDSKHRTFRITHPFHPWFGREFTLVTYRHNWNEDAVYFHTDQQQLIAIPARWTSVFPPDPVVVIADGRAPFRLHDLVELTRLIQNLRRPPTA